MLISFSHFYIDPDAYFPFSFKLNEALSAEFESKAKIIKVENGPPIASAGISFCVSAKRGILSGEVHGPEFSKKTNELEYTIFLPYDRIKLEKDSSRVAIITIIELSCRALRSIGYNVDLIELGAVRFTDSLIRRTDIIDAHGW